MRQSTKREMIQSDSELKILKRKQEVFTIDLDSLRSFEDIIEEEDLPAQQQNQDLNYELLPPVQMPDPNESWLKQPKETLEFVKQIQSMIDTSDNREVSDSESSSEEELPLGAVPAQPIYMRLFVNKKIGSKVLTGTTNDDPAILSRNFCELH